MMYRLIGALFAAALLINPFLSATYAADSVDDFLGDFMDQLNLGNTDTSFGFTSSDTISVSNKTNSAVDLIIPVIKKDGSNILKYEVFGGNASLDDFDSWDEQYAIHPIFEFSASDIKDDTLTLHLEDLSADVTYYVTITPMNGETSGNPTPNEVVFSLSSSSSSSSSSGGSNYHGSSDPDMNLANVTYDHDGLAINIRWNPLAGADQVQLSYATIDNSNNLTVAGTVSMNAGKFDFSVGSEGTYLVKLQPLNNGAAVGTEIMQTLHLVGASTDPDDPDPIPYVPAVGPEDYIPHIIVISIVGYFFLRRFRKRH